MSPFCSKKGNVFSFKVLESKDKFYFRKFAFERSFMILIENLKRYNALILSDTFRIFRIYKKSIFNFVLTAKLGIGVENS